MAIVSDNGNIWHCAQLAFCPTMVGIWPLLGIFTGRHSAGRHSGTHTHIHAARSDLLSYEKQELCNIW